MRRLDLTLDLLMSRVQFEPNSGCWLWEGAYDRERGYGFITCGRKRCRAHRASLSLALGRPLSAEEVVCHRCDTPACINPDHLFLGTHVDNAADMIAKGRGWWQSGKSARLSPSAVRAIRERHAAGEGYKRIAPHFGVTPYAIGKIIRGQSWGNVR